MNFNLIPFLLFSLSLFFTNCNADYDRIRSLELKGIIKGKGKSSPCFGFIEILENGQLDTVKQICYCANPSNSKIWEFAEKGDSLIKKNGSVEFQIIRHDITYSFTFPNCHY